MVKFKKMVSHVSKAIPAFALMLGTLSVSQACVLWFHQPKVPEEMKDKYVEKGER